jgi:hypothetical protein
MKADGGVHIDVVSWGPIDYRIAAAYSNSSQHVHVLQQQPRPECATPGSSMARDSTAPLAP